MAWIEPVTNRPGPVQYAIADLNRVGACVEYLTDAFNTAGYPVFTETKTNWTIEDIPCRSDMETYLNNVRRLVDVFYAYASTPDLPESLRYLNWQGANNIEQVLADLKDLIDKMIANYRYSGEIYSGEDDYID